MAFDVTNSFSNGTPADADEVNENFQDIVDEINDSVYGVMFTTLMEQAIDIIQLQQDASITGGTHTASIADIFSDSTGYLNTIDTGDTTSSYLTNALGSGASNVDSYTAGTGADSGEVTNGDFATGDLTGWTDTSTSQGTATVTSNACNLNSGGTPWTPGTKGEITQSVDVTGVSWIEFVVTNFSDPGTGANSMLIGSNTLAISSNGTKLIYCGNLTGSQDLIFRALNGSGGGGQVAGMTVDDIVAYNQATDDYTQTESLVSSNPTNITDTWLTVKNNDNTFPTGTYDVSSDAGATWTTGVNFNEKVNITSTQGDELKIRIIATADVHKAYSIAWWG